MDSGWAAVSVEDSGAYCFSGIRSVPGCCSGYELLSRLGIVGRPMFLMDTGFRIVGMYIYVVVLSAVRFLLSLFMIRVLCTVISLGIFYFHNHKEPIKLIFL